MIKLIVSDMDGTLLNDEKHIDKRIYSLLPKMREEGIRFVVASGRQYPSLARDFQEHLPEITVIAENGAFVVQDGKELYFKGMNEKQIAIVWILSKHYRKQKGLSVRNTAVIPQVRRYTTSLPAPNSIMTVNWWTTCIK